jgi:molybdenum cofactor cytidylyltransferase
MNLSRALRLDRPLSLAFVGSGGKSTAMFRLARELGAEARPVIVTSTTHLAVDQIALADSHWVARSSAELEGLEDRLEGIVLITGPLVDEGDRTSGLDRAALAWLHAARKRRSLPLLIEADGSRQRPLKAPGEHEPPIPDFVETVVVAAGLAGLGKPLTAEFVHRPEAFARLAGLQAGEPVTAEALARALTHPEGGLKNIPAGARRIALLNQADTAELRAQTKALAEMLLPAYQAVVVACLDPGASFDDPQSPIKEPHSGVHAVHELAAGIVLAAGGSRRMGRPKQLLDYRGQPFVRAVAATALEAGLSPVIVVTGAEAEKVEAALRDLPVRIVRNRDWQQGQSSSIRAGVIDLTHPHPAYGHPPLPSPNGRGKGRAREGIGEGKGEVGAAVFLLADQPQVSTAVLQALVERHSQDLPPVVAPLVGGRRANPVLFDRVTFPALLALQGDVGGRALFSRHPPAYLAWEDESLLVDVDRPEDLGRLRD